MRSGLVNTSSGEPDHEIQVDARLAAGCRDRSSSATLLRKKERRDQIVVRILSWASNRSTGQRPEVSSPLQLADRPPSWRGGLAGWQARRVSLHVDQHLSESLLCKDLARLVNLSISHFSRAFKASFGCSPHAYVTRRRMELAQGLMLTTDAPLRQIALDCGLADQAHLSRLFKRIVGDSPAAWRRARSQPSGILAGSESHRAAGGMAP